MTAVARQPRRCQLREQVTGFASQVVRRAAPRPVRKAVHPARTGEERGDSASRQEA